LKLLLYAVILEHNPLLLNFMWQIKQES